MALLSVFSLLDSGNHKDASASTAELSWPEHERRRNIALRRLRGILEAESVHTAEAEYEGGGSNPQPLD